jgi:hypothetical protein
VMTCLGTVLYAIVVNGQPMGRIVPCQGIRQGDSLSPYLFLLCVEALSSLLQHAETNGCITGVPTSKKGPLLSHLFFAYNILLVCKEISWSGED